jgi:hypothetical protein
VRRIRTLKAEAEKVDPAPETMGRPRLPVVREIVDLLEEVLGGRVDPQRLVEELEAKLLDAWRELDEAEFGR